MTNLQGVACKEQKGKNDRSRSSPLAKKSSGKRKSSSLPSETVEYLKAWMMSPEHIAHPYPTEQEKVEIMKDTKIELKQLTNWFVNNRKRYWKPRVEARLQQQAQAAQAAVQAHAAAVAAASVTSTLSRHQPVVPRATPDAAGTNLVSPQVGTFKFASQACLPSEPMKPPLIRFEAPPAPPSPLPQKPFVSHPLTLTTTQVSERGWKPFESVPRASTVVISNQTPSVSAASVSASEGEISDTGNNSDDASSDGAQILGKDLKFINLKMKKHLRKSTSSSVVSNMTSENSPETGNTRLNYARNVSFCSLDKIASEATSAYASDEIIRSSEGKKRINNDNEFPLVVATTPPKKRFRTFSVDLWRKKCQDASHIHDESLPSLEEATRLFGFTSA